MNDPYLMAFFLKHGGTYPKEIIEGAYAAGATTGRHEERRRLSVNTAAQFLLLFIYISLFFYGGWEAWKLWVIGTCVWMGGVAVGVYGHYKVAKYEMWREKARESVLR